MMMMRWWWWTTITTTTIITKIASKQVKKKVVNETWIHDFGPTLRSASLNCLLQSIACAHHRAIFHRCSYGVDYVLPLPWKEFNVPLQIQSQMDSNIQLPSVCWQKSQKKSFIKANNRHFDYNLCGTLDRLDKTFVQNLNLFHNNFSHQIRWRFGQRKCIYSYDPE